MPRHNRELYVVLKRGPGDNINVAVYAATSPHAAAKAEAAATGTVWRLDWFRAELDRQAAIAAAPRRGRPAGIKTPKRRADKAHEPGYDHSDPRLWQS